MYLAVQGIVELDPAISFHYGSSGFDDDSLQADHITALVRHQGIHLWGATLLVADTSTDPLRFLPVRRILDDIVRHLVDSSLDALRLNIGPGFGDYVITHTQRYIDTLIGRGALVAGSVTPDTEANTPAALSAGQANFNVTITPVFPAQQINYTVHVDTTALTI